MPCRDYGALPTTLAWGCCRGFLGNTVSEEYYSGKPEPGSFQSPFTHFPIPGSGLIAEFSDLTAINFRIIDYWEFKGKRAMLRALKSALIAPFILGIIRKTTGIWPAGIIRKSPSEKPPVFAIGGAISGARDGLDGHGEPGRGWQLHFLHRRNLQRGTIRQVSGRLSEDRRPADKP